MGCKPAVGARGLSPALEPVEDVVARRFELFEVSPNGSSTPVDRAGLGLIQLYTILGHALLQGTAAVAIEEPEAHLHAPTTGIAVRHLLRRLLDERFVDQLFVATHSNLFDLDPSGYWDVSLDEDGCTRVERVTDLTRIDERHLYEPGPARHALRQMLRYRPRDEIVYRTDDGAPVEAGTLLTWLEQDDGRALEFLRDLTESATRMIGARARSPRDDD